MQFNSSGSSAFGWFYDLLDTERAIGIAVADARRCTTWQQALFGFFVNACLCTFFGCLWVRYDLWSTSTVFLPVVNNIAGVIPASGDIWSTVNLIARLVLGVVVSLLTSLLQAAYPRLARQYRGAQWALAFSVIFDLATDYKDVATDFPTYFKALIEASATTATNWWLAAAGVLFVAAFIWSSQRALFWMLAAACGLCLVLPPPTVWHWAVVFVTTIFCSFAVQSLAMLHLAKCLALVAMVRRLGAAVAD